MDGWRALIVSTLHFGSRVLVSCPTFSWDKKKKLSRVFLRQAAQGGVTHATAQFDKRRTHGQQLRQCLFVCGTINTLCAAKEIIYDEVLLELCTHMMSSPSVYYHAPILLDEERQSNNGDGYQKNNHSRKRRPVDPPEEGTMPQIDDYNVTNKRRRIVPDDLLGTLSLKAPDPPAYSFCKRKKEHHDDDSIGNSSERYAKLPRCEKDDDDELQEGGAITSKRKAGDDDETTQFILPSATATQNTSPEMDSEMSIDDNSSINSNSDGSISEGSLQRAMYQAVFGRRNNINAQHVPATISGSGGNGAGNCKKGGQ